MRKLILIFIIGLIIGLISLAQGQLPQTFINTAHINTGAYAVDVAIGNDSTIFMTNYYDGLRAYTYNDSSFTNVAHIANGELAHDVKVKSDGTIFLANYDGGLRAYTFNDSFFTETAHIDDGGIAYGVAISSYGTIFLANYNDGLRAYIYNDTSFTNTAHINIGGTAHHVAVDSAGNIFVAEGGGGLRAYTYNGSSFTETAHIDDGGIAYGVTVGIDGTIFLANYPDGLRAYTYHDSLFTNTAHISNGGSAHEIAVGDDGTIFLGNYDDGLRAYTYDGSSFTNTAYINDGGNAEGVVVGHDNTIFLANGSDGLRAYTYSGYVSALVAYYPFNGNANDESGNGYHGLINGATLTTDRFNNPNSAFEFDGANDYIEVPGTENIDIQSEITISAWVKLDDLSAGNCIVTKWLPGQKSFYLYEREDSERFQFVLWEDGDVFIVELLSNTSAVVGTWTHIAATYDGSSAIIYYNGQLDASQTASGLIHQGGSDIEIGRDNYSNHPLNGRIDDICIYNYALNAQEIDSLYQYNGWTTINNVVSAVPATFVLKQNYPNPFNPVTNIRFGLPKTSQVKIEVFNVLGQRVATLLDEYKSAGYHTVQFDGSNFSSGVYYYKFQAGEFSQVRKMLFVR